MKRKAAPPQLDIFVAEIVDPDLKDDGGSMHLPMFSIAKRKCDRMEPLRWEDKKRGIWVEVSPNVQFGMATIWDNDFLMALASMVHEAHEAGEPTNRRMHVCPHHLLTITKRDTGGAGYREMVDALDRLKATSIKTNIPADGETILEHWSWIDYYKAHLDPAGRVKFIEVHLSEWLYNRIVQDDMAVLSVHEDYFLLTGGIEKQLYRIVRKLAGGREAGWWLSVAEIHSKMGSKRRLPAFKSDLRAVVNRDALPEYHMSWRREGRVDYVDFWLRADALTRRHAPPLLRDRLIPS